MTWKLLTQLGGRLHAERRGISASPERALPWMFGPLTCCPLARPGTATRSRHRRLLPQSGGQRSGLGARWPSGKGALVSWRSQSSKHAAFLWASGCARARLREIRLRTQRPGAWEEDVAGTEAVAPVLLDASEVTPSNGRHTVVAGEQGRARRGAVSVLPGGLGGASVGHSGNLPWTHRTCGGAPVRKNRSPGSEFKEDSLRPPSPHPVAMGGQRL